jgi:hypothetical protein
MRARIAIFAATLACSPITALAGAVPVTTRITFHAERDNSNRDDAAGRAMLRSVASAQSEINRVVTELRKMFEESTELREARLAVQTARANYLDAVNAAVAPLHESAEYKRAAERVNALERRLAWGYIDDHLTDRQRADTAADLFKARQTVSAMQADVLAADENVSNARFALIDANGAVVALQRSFQESIASHPDYVDARARLDAARSQIASRSRR